MALHAEAERAGIMPRLLRGQIDRATYCALLRNLHTIYAALEPALALHAAHPLVAPLHAPTLRRQQALAADLELLHGEGWAAEIPVRPAAADCAQRLVGQPERLVAHAYVRYLGDLSGGQMLSRIVTESLHLDPGIGVAFYDFGGASDVERLSHRLRQGLDSLPADAASAERIVTEAQLSFGLHIRLFGELAAERPATSVC